MGQGSSSEAETTLRNTEFWLKYLDFEARWAELELEWENFEDGDD